MSSGEEACSSLPPPHYSPAAVRLHFAVVLVDNGAQSIDPNAQVRDREHYMSTFVVIIDVRDNQTAPSQGFILLNQVTVQTTSGLFLSLHRIPCHETDYISSEIRLAGRLCHNPGYPFRPSIFQSI